MKSITIRIVGEKSDGTVVSKTQNISPPWNRRMTNAEFLERAEKAAIAAVRSVLK
jgi:hypothetical protein